MGICLSARIKAESPSDTGVNLKCASSDGKDQSGSTSKGSSSFSVPPTPRSEGEILQSPNLKSFSFSELKMATRNFRPDSLLGEGGFGSVFKGWIDEHLYAPSKPGTGMVIAVKRLNAESYQGHREWLAEIGSHLTAKSDVYGYGVVVLEMLSGQRAVDKNRPSGRHNLVEWARPYMTNKRKVFRILDSRLESQYNLDAAHKVAILAFRCLSTEAKFRPTMAEVVKELEQLHDSMEMGSAHNNGSDTGIKSRRRSAEDARTLKAAASYPRPSASLLYA
ncbi:hypothetical protein Ancab_011627 [Ancistrocladus abbreviatus]